MCMYITLQYLMYVLSTYVCSPMLFWALKPTNAGVAYDLAVLMALAGRLYKSDKFTYNLFL